MILLQRLTPFEILFDLTAKVCQNLRDKNWQTSSIHIKLRYSDFKTLTRSKKIEPTDDDKVIYEIARICWIKLLPGELP
jgi:DNA polymerase IV